MSNIFDRRISQREMPLSSGEHSKQEHPPHPDSHGTNTDQTASTSPEVKKATQELLKHGYLEEAQKRELFRSVVLHEHEIQTVLEPLDLSLRLDTYRGVAFLIVAQSAYENADGEGAWIHPLVRRQRLTLEQSLLVAILRQAFVIHEQEAGIGQHSAKVTVEDLLPQFMAYFADSGSDAKNESRLLNLLDQLKPHGIVSEVDKNNEVTIRPLIVYVADPQSLTALLDVLKSQIPMNEITEHDL